MRPAARVKRRDRGDEIVEAADAVASPSEFGRAPCSCGSGLPADRCCSLDGTVTWPQPRREPDVESARASGNIAEAEPRLIAVLERSPLHVGALLLLQALRAAQNRPRAAVALLRRIVRLDPNNAPATQALALALFSRSALGEAEAHARNGVRIAPLDPQSHNLMGMILTEAQRPQVGEHHYRRAMDLLPSPSPILYANLAWNLKNQGRMDESRAYYEKSVALDPDIFQTLYGWAKMEESDRDFPRAFALLDAAEKLAPGAPSLWLERAVLHGRVKRYDEALDALGEIERGAGRGLGPLEASEKGKLLDKMGRPVEAFAAFAEAKRSLREITGQTYLAEDAAALARRLRGFFTAARLKILPRAGARADVAGPIFIVGFPRSGTTMIEQTLSAHPAIAAGDELPVINELSALLPRMFDSPLSYPDALAELWLGDRLEGLDNLRDYYLQRARQLGATREGAPWFTDKMPLNETHLGLIGLIFPQAPILHVVRHPLDVALSVFSNHLTHGFYCAYDLESIARHYVLVMDLVEHYLAEMPGLRYLRVRYEDVIDGQEAKVREMLDFVGLPFDSRCLSFHENRRYARTASYAQVTEKLYDRSRYRYRDYLEQLAPVIPILAPTIARLGYEVG
jgi:tetratricopeptide (TPR) repeat protein